MTARTHMVGEQLQSVEFHGGADGRFPAAGDGMRRRRSLSLSLSRAQCLKLLICPRLLSQAADCHQKSATTTTTTWDERADGKTRHPTHEIK